MVIDRREIERLLPALRRYARGLTGNVSRADDLVHDAVVIALSKERQFSGGNLGGWMFAILVNAARSQARRERRGPFVAALDDPADGGVDPASRVAIFRALEAPAASIARSCCSSPSKASAIARPPKFSMFRSGRSCRALPAPGINSRKGLKAPRWCRSGE